MVEFGQPDRYLFVTTCCLARRTSRGRRREGINKPDELSAGAFRTSSPLSATACCVSDQPLNTEDEVTDKAIAHAIGEELRRARETKGMSRAQFVKLLPSGISDRTLLAYEHGLRQMSVLRLIELSEGLRIPASAVLAQALERARIHLENLVLRVDLRELIADENRHYRPMRQWAKNRLSQEPGGIVELVPAAVLELAAFLGRTQTELATYLAKFTPEPVLDDQ